MKYSERISSNKLSIKDIVHFVFICLILLLRDLLQITSSIIIKYDEKNDNNNVNNFIIIEYLILFFVSKYEKEVHYKHHNISFLILISVEAIETIYFFIEANSYQTLNIIKIILEIINSILFAIYCLFIQRLMKYNFISPEKCNFMIGIVNTPLVIIIYIIISFTSLENINGYYVDSIFELFKDIENIDVKHIFLLISLPFALGVLAFIINKIIYDYSIYHTFIPFLIENFMSKIIKDLNIFGKIALILSFLMELIMILVFLEIIEINFCGLNQNLKRNIESRGIIDSSLINDDDEIDDEENEK